MGILFTQRDSVWRIEIRERWLVPRAELDGVCEVLIDHKIQFSVTTVEKNIYIDMQNASCEYERFNEAQKALLEIIGFKKAFGQLKPECRSKQSARMKEIFGGEDDE